MTLSEFRNHILLLVIGSYLVLNYGVMVIRIPPTSVGLPLGELAIIFFLLTIHYQSSIYNFKTIFPINLLMIWWGYILLRTLAGFTECGIWAFRDATNVIESLFLVGGFIFAQHPENVERIFRWLPKLFLIACLYGLTFPFSLLLQEISPKVSGGSGQLVSLLGMYTNSAVMLLWCAFFIMIFSTSYNINPKKKYYISAGLIAYAVIIFQARTIYLQIITIFLFFFFYRKDLFSKSALAIIFCLALVFLFPFLDLKISGRLGQNVSIKFIIRHFIAIFGIASENLEQSAGGVILRTEWWRFIFSRLFSSWSNFFIGLGYGFPLIDFHVTGGIAVREPHNSYISFFARSGFIGLSFFFWVHWRLLKVWNWAYCKCKDISWDKGKDMLLSLMVYFILIWIYAIGEDAFEKPFNTIPYYFFWGIVLRFAYHLKKGAIGPEDTHHQNSARS